MKTTMPQSRRRTQAELVLRCEVIRNGTNADAHLQQCDCTDGAANAHIADAGPRLVIAQSLRRWHSSDEN